MRRTGTIGPAVPALLLLLTLAPPQASAAFEELEIGVADQAMGGTGVVGLGPSSVLSNPASLARGGGWTVYASSRLPFTAFDFATHGLDVSTSVTDTWSAGASMRVFGFEDYAETLLAFTAAGRLGRGMLFGVQPVFGKVDIADGQSSYGSASAFSLNAGIQAEVYSRWMLAASVRNVFESRIGESGETFGRKLDAGLSYEPSAGLVSRVVLSRDYRGMRIHVGQSVPVGPLSVLAGVRTDPAVLTAGLSARVSGIELQYGFESHPDLSPTHQFGVGYAF